MTCYRCSHNWPTTIVTRVQCRHCAINQRSKPVISCKCNRKASNDNDRCGPRERRRGRDKRHTYTALDGPDQCT